MAQILTKIRDELNFEAQPRILELQKNFKEVKAKNLEFEKIKNQNEAKLKEFKDLLEQTQAKERLSSQKAKEIEIQVKELQTQIEKLRKVKAGDKTLEFRQIQDSLWQKDVELLRLQEVSGKMSSQLKKKDIEIQQLQQQIDEVIAQANLSNMDQNNEENFIIKKLKADIKTKDQMDQAIIKVNSALSYIERSLVKFNFKDQLIQFYQEQVENLLSQLEELSLKFNLLKLNYQYTEKQGDQSSLIFNQQQRLHLLKEQQTKAYIDQQAAELQETKQKNTFLGNQLAKFKTIVYLDPSKFETILAQGLISTREKTIIGIVQQNIDQTEYLRMSIIAQEFAKQLVEQEWIQEKTLEQMEFDSKIKNTKEKEANILSIEKRIPIIEEKLQIQLGKTQEVAEEKADIQAPLTLLQSIILQHMPKKKEEELIEPQATEFQQTGTSNMKQRSTSQTGQSFQNQKKVQNVNVEQRQDGRKPRVANDYVKKPTIQPQKFPFEQVLQLLQQIKEREESKDQKVKQKLKESSETCLLVKQELEIIKLGLKVRKNENNDNIERLRKVLTRLCAQSYKLQLRDLQNTFLADRIQQSTKQVVSVKDQVLYQQKVESIQKQCLGLRNKENELRAAINKSKQELENKEIETENYKMMATAYENQVLVYKKQNEAISLLKKREAEENKNESDIPEDEIVKLTLQLEEQIKRNLELQFLLKQAIQESYQKDQLLQGTDSLIFSISNSVELVNKSIRDGLNSEQIQKTKLNEIGGNMGKETLFQRFKNLDMSLQQWALRVPELVKLAQPDRQAVKIENNKEEKLTLIYTSKIQALNQTISLMQKHFKMLEQKLSSEACQDKDQVETLQRQIKLKEVFLKQQTTEIDLIQKAVLKNQNSELVAFVLPEERKALEVLRQFDKKINIFKDFDSGFIGLLEKDIQVMKMMEEKQEKQPDSFIASQLQKIQSLVEKSFSIQESQKYLKLLQEEIPILLSIYFRKQNQVQINHTAPDFRNQEIKGLKERNLELSSKVQILQEQIKQAQLRNQALCEESIVNKKLLSVKGIQTQIQLQLSQLIEENTRLQGLVFGFETKEVDSQRRICSLGKDLEDQRGLNLSILDNIKVEQELTQTLQESLLNQQKRLIERDQETLFRLRNHSELTKEQAQSLLVDTVEILDRENREYRETNLALNQQLKLKRNSLDNKKVKMDHQRLILKEYEQKLKDLVKELEETKNFIHKEKPINKDKIASEVGKQGADYAISILQIIKDLESKVDELVQEKISLKVQGSTFQILLKDRQSRLDKSEEELKQLKTEFKQRQFSYDQLEKQLSQLNEDYMIQQNTLQVYSQVVLAQNSEAFEKAVQNQQMLVKTLAQLSEQRKYLREEMVDKEKELIILKTQLDQEIILKESALESSKLDREEKVKLESQLQKANQLILRFEKEFDLHIKLGSTPLLQLQEGVNKKFDDDEFGTPNPQKAKTPSKKLLIEETKKGLSFFSILANSSQAREQEAQKLRICLSEKSYQIVQLQSKMAILELRFKDALTHSFKSQVGQIQTEDSNLILKLQNMVLLRTMLSGQYSHDDVLERIKAQLIEQSSQITELKKQLQEKGQVVEVQNADQSKDLALLQEELLQKETQIQELKGEVKLVNFETLNEQLQSLVDRLKDELAVYKDENSKFQAQDFQTSSQFSSTIVQELRISHNLNHSMKALIQDLLLEKEQQQEQLFQTQKEVQYLQNDLEITSDKLMKAFDQLETKEKSQSIEEQLETSKVILSYKRYLVQEAENRRVERENQRLRVEAERVKIDSEKKRTENLKLKKQLLHLESMFQTKNLTQQVAQHSSASSPEPSSRNKAKDSQSTAQKSLNEVRTANEDLKSLQESLLIKEEEIQELEVKLKARDFLIQELSSYSKDQKQALDAIQSDILFSSVEQSQYLLSRNIEVQAENEQLKSEHIVLKLKAEELKQFLKDNTELKVENERFKVQGELSKENHGLIYLQNQLSNYLQEIGKEKEVNRLQSLQILELQRQLSQSLIQLDQFKLKLKSLKKQQNQENDNNANQQFSDKLDQHLNSLRQHVSYLKQKNNELQSAFELANQNLQAAQEVMDSQENYSYQMNEQFIKMGKEKEALELELKEKQQVILFFQQKLDQIIEQKLEKNQFADQFRKELVELVQFKQDIRDLKEEEEKQEMYFQRPATTRPMTTFSRHSMHFQQSQKLHQENQELKQELSKMKLSLSLVEIIQGSKNTSEQNQLLIKMEKKREKIVQLKRRLKMEDENFRQVQLEKQEKKEQKYVKVYTDDRLQEQVEELESKLRMKEMTIVELQVQVQELEKELQLLHGQDQMTEVGSILVQKKNYTPVRRRSSLKGPEMNPQNQSREQVLADHLQSKESMMFPAIMEKKGPQSTISMSKQYAQFQEGGMKYPQSLRQKTPLRNVLAAQNSQGDYGTHYEFQVQQNLELPRHRKNNSNRNSKVGSHQL